MNSMTKPPPPQSPSVVLVIIRKEAMRRELTAYALARETGLGINTVQRMLDGVVSPSLNTLEVVAKALGLAIKVEREDA